ncbi:MAG: hypothetical protein RPT25_02255 [Cycloclasticus sp.]
MDKTNLVHFLTEQTKRKARKREFKMLAQLLAQQLHISQGDHLVLFLGSGDERSNVDAIAYWLAEKGQYIESMKAIQIDPLNRLYDELSKKLCIFELGQ